MSTTVTETILTLISVFCAAVLGYLLASGKAWLDLERLRAAVRRHRDERGDDRCWLDDEVLYAALPEGYSPLARDTAVELANCARFIANRQNPVTEYVSPNVEIDRLRGIVNSLAARVAAQSALLSACAETQSPLGSPVPADGPEIITLCGSTKFKQQYIGANFHLTMMGKIVLGVGLYVHADACTLTPEDKVRLDWLHLRKIDHSHAIYVINVGGYVGESTGREIAYARATGKRIYWHETPPGEPDLKPLPSWLTTIEFTLTPAGPPLHPQTEAEAHLPPVYDHLPVVTDGDESARRIYRLEQPAIIETCHSHKDGDCDWQDCPQQRDGEPGASGRHCPLDVEDQQ